MLHLVEDDEPGTDPLLGAVCAELGDGDPVVLELGRRLARLAGGSGPAAVAALKALGELIDAQRRAR
jgi:hypothetical protein